LKWGKYNGVSNSETTTYLNRIVSDWKNVIATGPASAWQDNYGTYNGGSCSNNIGWYEGDLALRSWIVGALPSYDTIRDDISSTDRSTIDSWFRTLAGKMYAEKDFAITHNRGDSRLAQAHLMYLVLQDATSFNTIWTDSNEGFDIIIQQFNYAPSSSCSGFISYTPGLSDEHSYKTGGYGRSATKNAFGGLLSITHAARNGGDSNWDPLNSPDRPLLDGILNTWLSYGVAQRTNYINYARCLEVNWSGAASTTDSSLDAAFWMSFAFLNPQFLSYNYWDPNDIVALIWQKRAALLAGASTVPPLNTLTLTLVNATTGQDLGPLTAGTAVDLSKGNKLNIRANPSNPVGSVRFSYDATSNYSTDGIVPYSFAGDSNGLYKSWTPTVGNHTVVATAYSGSNATGTVVSTVTAAFTVVNPVAVGTTLTLVNADTDKDIAPLTNGTVIKLSTNSHLNIRANPPVSLGSVRFSYDSNSNYRTENTAPYAFAGDSGGNYSVWTPTVGSHTVTASPYTGSDATGTLTNPVTVTFSVIN
jgi:hypothetical protein